MSEEIEMPSITSDQQTDQKMELQEQPELPNDSTADAPPPADPQSPG